MYLADPTATLTEIVSLNALDLTVEALEQRLELSYVWIGTQPDSGCIVHRCPHDCVDCMHGCLSNDVCGTNTCPGGNCPEGPDPS